MNWLRLSYSRFSLTFISFCLLFGITSVYCDVSEVDRLFFGPQESGYVYPPPPIPPVQLDEPPPSYLPPLPPIFAEEIPFIPAPNPPPSNYLPPSPPTGYLPPSNEIFPPTISNDDSIVIPGPPPQVGGPYPPSQSLLPPQLRIENMSCTQGMNFRATFKMTNDLPQFPVMDDSTEGCISSAGGNMFRIDLESFNSMLKCGVRRCSGGLARSKTDGLNVNSQTGENMCVVVRIPTVRGVRLPEDGMVTLMCIPQEKVVSQTRHVKLGSNKIQQTSRARSNNGFVATGGSQKDLRTKIGIFRRRTGGKIFDQNVQSDSVIQLGEELVLRAVVNEGDGWRNSQIGPVIVTGLNSKKSALLVNQQGCVNPVMRTICPRQPLKINPLGTELYFRAFLFQESPQGDEMVVSVRTQGCLHPQDCTRSESCVDDPSTRSKRELSNSSFFSNENGTHLKNSIVEEIKNWESQLSFKVGPVLKRKKISYDNSMQFSFLYVSFAGMALSVLVVLLLVWQMCCRKKKS